MLYRHQNLNADKIIMKTVGCGPVDYFILATHHRMIKLVLRLGYDEVVSSKKKTEIIFRLIKNNLNKKCLELPFS